MADVKLERADAIADPGPPTCCFSHEANSCRPARRGRLATRIQSAYSRWLQITVAEVVEGGEQGHEQVENGIGHHDTARCGARGEWGQVERASRSGLHDVRGSAPDRFTGQDDAREDAEGDEAV